MLVQKTHTFFFIRVLDKIMATNISRQIRDGVMTDFQKGLSPFYLNNAVPAAQLIPRKSS